MSAVFALVFQGLAELSQTESEFGVDCRVNVENIDITCEIHMPLGCDQGVFDGRNGDLTIPERRA